MKKCPYCGKIHIIDTVFCDWYYCPNCNNAIKENELIKIN